MKDIWYGDDRDVLKWATVMDLSQSYPNIHSVVQVAYYRKTHQALVIHKVDEHMKHLAIEENILKLQYKVFDKSICKIKALEEAIKQPGQEHGTLTNSHLLIHVFDVPFEPTHQEKTHTPPYRTKYMDLVIKELENPLVRGGPKENLIVLLDPDNGMESKSKAGPEHVKWEELFRLYQKLHVGDIVVIYQHAPMASHIKYNLLLLSPMIDIPTTGKNLVVVAQRDVLEFHIFDKNGDKVVQEDETTISGKTQEIEHLRNGLRDLWPPHKLSKDEKNKLIPDVTSIVDHTSWHLTKFKTLKNKFDEKKRMLKKPPTKFFYTYDPANEGPVDAAMYVIVM